MGSRLLEQLRSSLNENMDNSARESTEKGIAVLEAYVAYTKKTDFHVGDYVKWKKGMQNRGIPEDDDDFGIVTEVLAEPIFDPTRKSAGNPGFREPLTIRVGVIIKDGFHEFFMDGNRMETLDYDSMDEDKQSLADKLKEMRERLYQPNEEQLKPGDIVQWKTGLKNTKRPDYNQQCVVMETFPAFFQAKRGAGATGFREPCDVRIGILDEDEDLMIYLFDSRRFEKVPESRWSA